MRRLTVLLLLINFTEASAQSTKKNYSESPISITLQSTVVPIIEGKLNGKKAYFLIDTGSTLSVIDLSKKKYFGFKIYNRLGSQVQGFGGNGLSLWRIFDVNLQIGDKQISTAYIGAPLQKLKQGVERKTGYEISGIIGSDVIKNYGIIVDYANEQCFIGIGKNIKYDKDGHISMMIE